MKRVRLPGQGTRTRSRSGMHSRVAPGQKWIVSMFQHGDGCLRSAPTPPASSLLDCGLVGRPVAKKGRQKRERKKGFRPRARCKEGNSLCSAGEPALHTLPREKNERKKERITLKDMRQGRECFAGEPALHTLLPGGRPHLQLGLHDGADVALGELHPVLQPVELCVLGRKRDGLGRGVNACTQDCRGDTESQKRRYVESEEEIWRVRREDMEI